MKRFLAAVAFVMLPVCAPAAAVDGDTLFLAARDAYAKGDRAALASLAAQLDGHPLAPWARYFQLSLQLRDMQKPSDAGVAEFVEAETGSWLGEKLRSEWLKWLVDRQDWPRALEQFSLLARPDQDAVCRGLMARLQLGDGDAAQEAGRLLAASQPLAASCLPPLGQLAGSGALPSALLWERLFRQWSLGRLAEARVIASWLPAAPAPRELDEAAEHPMKTLLRLGERLPRQKSAAHEIDRGAALAALAVLRIARADARVAAARWLEIEKRAPDELAGIVWTRLAYQAALAHLPEATEWFARAEKFAARFDADEQAWRIRAALRAQDWPLVLRATHALPEALALRPEWRYWRARALEASGQVDAARALYRDIAGQNDFYGILAAEALGGRLSIPPRAQPLSRDEQRSAAAHPLLQRALALIRAGLRSDGVREWNWALDGMNDRQLLAAADFAQRNEALDRAIQAAERTRAEHDFRLRYPTPFSEQILAQARAVALDPAWLYGLMRQESRFVMDARSSAGARGLMQLMPGTAKWVAKKIGLADYHPHRMTELETNLRLGAHYLRMTLDSLDEHPVLATAAYNAGPGRARKWRAERPLEGAIYVETIPFNETRDYVKKVMANALHYAVMMNLPAPTLTQRLGVIRARGVQEVNVEELP